MAIQMVGTKRLIRVSIFIILNAMLVIALISLFFLDKLVNEFLYNYGLVFSLTWAEPYWLMMRTSMVLIAIVVLIFCALEILYPLWLKKS